MYRYTFRCWNTYDNIKITDSVIASSLGKNKHVIDLDGLPSGVYRAAVSTTNIQDSVKFSVGLEAGSGAISLSSTQENYSPGDSILILGNTGNNARLTLTLLDPSGNTSSETEIFSDSTGNFSTYNVGIPSSASTGDWKITAYSRLDSVSKTIQVVFPQMI